LRWNGLTGEVHLFEFGASDWKKLYGREPQRDETYIAEWRDFIDSIQEKKNPQITGDDGLKVLQVIEAARISSSTGKQELTSCIDPIQWPSE
jgi:predicted dehydrogenase